MKLELKYTSDGSATFYLPEYDDHYHSVNGAVTESKYVFLEKGYACNSAPRPKVLEIGFGSGLNCLLTAHEAQLKNRPTFYTTIEKNPVLPEKALLLDYGKFISGGGDALFQAIHSCAWNIPVKISPWFTLLKMQADFVSMGRNPEQKADIIYFDAFGPDKQPEMWTASNLLNLFEMTEDNGVFVTYSAKGEVRRNLASAGYRVERLPGPPGKKEMLRAIKVITES